MSSVSPLTEIFQFSGELAGKPLEVIVGTPVPGSVNTLPRLLYVVDPYLYMPAAIDMARAMARDREPIVPLIVVGVGTSIRSHQDSVDYMLRTRNGLLVPPEEGINDSIMANVANQPAPEAHRFLRFIADELDPLLRQRYEISPDPAGLFGHSYGGLFAAYALAEQPPVFDRYILSSTGVLPERQMLPRLEHAPAGSLQGRVYLGLGEGEDACAAEYTGDLGVGWHRLMQALAPPRQPKIQLRAEIHAAQGHATAPLFNLARGLRWLYAAGG
ncbi:MAG TPA: alpha/beta hydrolase-fold protein [Fontimonas sp.]